MNVLNRELLVQAGVRHTDAKVSLDAWLTEAMQAQWMAPMDIKRRYATASFLGGNVVIFNVRGNRYRLVVKVNYSAQVVLVKWFGTHAEYDKEKC
jgi:mRNA interferase HigB